jgi:hypothetical protein
LDHANLSALFLPAADIDVMRGQVAAVCLIPLFSACRERLVNVGNHLDILCALREKDRKDECQYAVAENPSSIIIAEDPWSIAAICITYLQCTFQSSGATYIWDQVEQALLIEDVVIPRLLPTHYIMCTYNTRSSIYIHIVTSAMMVHYQQNFWPSLH